jgi:hypothetical protein
LIALEIADFGTDFTLLTRPKSFCFSLCYFRYFSCYSFIAGIGSEIVYLTNSILADLSSLTIAEIPEY